MKKIVINGMVMAFLLLSNLFLTPVNAWGQDEKELEAIRSEIDNVYSKKIQETLNKDKPRINKMKSEAEAIDKQKEPQAKKKAADNYVKAHKGYYQSAMRSAGININSVLAGLKSKFPNYSFTSTDGIAIEMERKNSGSTSESGTDVSSSSTGVSIESTTTAQTLSFNQNKSISCALASGGSVSFGTRSVTSTSTSAVAGGCSAHGELIKTTVLPSTGVKSIVLKLNYTLSVKGYAVGILGTSITSANGMMYVNYSGQSGYLIRSSISRTAIAPILWVASFDTYTNFANTKDLTSLKGKTLEVKGYANSSTFSALCCATNSRGRNSITTATLNITK